jgi:hypothetical protein
MTNNLESYSLYLLLAKNEVCYDGTVDSIVLKSGLSHTEVENIVKSMDPFSYDAPQPLNWSQIEFLAPDLVNHINKWVEAWQGSPVEVF